MATFAFQKKNMPWLVGRLFGEFNGFHLDPTEPVKLFKKYFGSSGLFVSSTYLRMQLANK